MEIRLDQFASAKKTLLSVNSKPNMTSSLRKATMKTSSLKNKVNNSGKLPAKQLTSIKEI